MTPNHRCQNISESVLLKLPITWHTNLIFVNYTFREEMILDGIENCITYIDNFNPEKSKNPFAYFTQITYYAFLRRIQKEKKQLDAKYRYIQSLDTQSMMDELARWWCQMSSLSI